MTKDMLRMSTGCLSNASVRKVELQDFVTQTNMALYMNKSVYYKHT